MEKWTQDTLGGTTVYSGKSIVAQCVGFEREENIAHAALIAAAPELLAALVRVRDAFRARSDAPAHERIAAIVQANVAIAKATA